MERKIVHIKQTNGLYRPFQQKILMVCQWLKILVWFIEVLVPLCNYIGYIEMFQIATQYIGHMTFTCIKTISFGMIEET